MDTKKFDTNELDAEQTLRDLYHSPGTGYSLLKVCTEKPTKMEQELPNNKSKIFYELRPHTQKQNQKWVEKRTEKLSWVISDNNFNSISST